MQSRSSCLLQVLARGSLQRIGDGEGSASEGAGVILCGQSWSLQELAHEKSTIGREDWRAKGKLARDAVLEKFWRENRECKGLQTEK
jgi:hypothetical protein